MIPINRIASYCISRFFFDTWSAGWIGCSWILNPRSSIRLDIWFGWYFELRLDFLDASRWISVYSCLRTAFDALICLRSGFGDLIRAFRKLLFWCDKDKYSNVTAADDNYVKRMDRSALGCAKKFDGSRPDDKIQSSQFPQTAPIDEGSPPQCLRIVDLGFRRERRWRFRERD
jgi:hypothetical protein